MILATAAGGAVILMTSSILRLRRFLGREKKRLRSTFETKGIYLSFYSAIAGAASGLVATPTATATATATVWGGASDLATAGISAESKKRWLTTSHGDSDLFVFFSGLLARAAAGVAATLTATATVGEQW